MRFFFFFITYSCFRANTADFSHHRDLRAPQCLGHLLSGPELLPDPAPWGPPCTRWHWGRGKTLEARTAVKREKKKGLRRLMSFLLIWRAVAAEGWGMFMWFWSPGSHPEGHRASCYWDRLTGHTRRAADRGPRSLHHTPASRAQELSRATRHTVPKQSGGSCDRGGGGGSPPPFSSSPLTTKGPDGLDRLSRRHRICSNCKMRNEWRCVPLANHKWDIPQWYTVYKMCFHVLDPGLPKPGDLSDQF